MNALVLRRPEDDCDDEFSNKIWVEPEDDEDSPGASPVEDAPGIYSRQQDGAADEADVDSPVWEAPPEDYRAELGTSLGQTLLKCLQEMAAEDDGEEVLSATDQVEIMGILGQAWDSEIAQVPAVWKVSTWGTLRHFRIGDGTFRMTLEDVKLHSTTKIQRLPNLRILGHAPKRAKRTKKASSLS